MPAEKSVSNEPSATTTASAITSTILLFSLNKESFWDEQYATLVDLISTKAAIKRVIRAESALTYLSSNTPTAIILTDAALTEPEPKFDAIRRVVVEYAHGGGTVIMGTHFNSYVRPLDMNDWLSNSWSLPWQSGDYHRTTVHLNPDSCGGRFSNVGLPTAYSQKAVFLKNVAKDAAVYSPSDGSHVESAVFAPSPVDTEQTPVAFTKIGNGWLGYVGDVNSERGSDAVIAAMCGL